MIKVKLKLQYPKEAIGTQKGLGKSYVPFLILNLRLILRNCSASQIFTLNLGGSFNIFNHTFIWDLFFFPLLVQQVTTCHWEYLKEKGTLPRANYNVYWGGEGNKRMETRMGRWEKKMRNPVRAFHFHLNVTFSRALLPPLWSHSQHC